MWVSSRHRLPGKIRIKKCVKARVLTPNVSSLSSCVEFIYKTILHQFSIIAYFISFTLQEQEKVYDFMIVLKVVCAEEQVRIYTED